MNNLSNKKQVTSNKQETIAQDTKGTYWDLEKRTTKFARLIIQTCKKLPNNSINNPLISQIVRSGGSIGANYREANDSLGKRDFLNRLRIARKEAKETQHWLECLWEANVNYRDLFKIPMQEVCELQNILSAIIRNSE